MARLSKEQWLDHGLKTLAADGFTALKADKLCKSLGVSRGSFYWHFKDLADFHAALLERWQEVAVGSVIEMLESQFSDPADKLGALIKMGIENDRSLEQAVRAWAFSHASVQKRVEAIDRQALGYVERLLIEIGMKPDQAKLRGIIIYSGYLGQLLLRQNGPTIENDLLVAELMQLAI